MNGRIPGLLVPALLLALPLGFSTCSGSSSHSSPGARAGGGLAITRCNLGCSVTGCSISEIAVNQPLNFDFSKEINPDTVNSNTIKMRTPTGNEPVGDFLVQGKSVFFFPEAKVVGEGENAKTFFGFESGQTYTLTIPSGHDSLTKVESMSGDSLDETFVCRLSVSRGIVDFDGKPPTASLLIPSSSLQCVGGNTLILIEFSEIVAAATLLGDSKTAGVTFGLAQFDSQGRCSINALPISGTRTVSVSKTTQRTRLLFRPAFQLPGDFCVRVNVTDRVRDLSGKRARAVTFEFKTCAGGGEEKKIVDDFSNPNKTRDDLRNGAKWETGNVAPSPLGGGGVLGDFNIRFGHDQDDPRSGKDKDADGRTIYYWNTDKSVIPGIRTLSGQDITVTNGIYEFTSFELKESEHLRFTGSKLPVIRVAGEMEVAGVLSLAAPDVVKAKSSIKGRPPFDGEAGQPGALGGGKGGRGGDSPHKTQTKKIEGSDGENVQVPAGHPLRGNEPGTGGKGAPANPKSGKDADVCFTAYQASICQQGASGGGGGGYVTAGKGGKCIDNLTGFNGHPPKACDFGEASVGGAALKGFDTLFSRSEKSSFLFMIGGSGGGGGGAGPHGAFDERPGALRWSPGGGGGGGGGPLHLQIGGDLFVAARGLITVKGADGPDYDYDVSDFWNYAPGGGGAGGTLLIQIAGLPDLRGAVVATGGKGGRMRSDPNFDLRLDSLSGDGGDGFVLFESTPRIPITQLGVLQPPAQERNSRLFNTADTNDESLLATRFYDTNLFFPPKYQGYEIEATIDTQRTIFRDEEGKRADANAAITLLVQGAQLDPDTKLPDPESLSKWFVGSVDGLNLAGGNGFRVILRFKNEHKIQVHKMTYFYKG